jgi:hypothetical protein
MEALTISSLSTNTPEAIWFAPPDRAYNISFAAIFSVSSNND